MSCSRLPACLHGEGFRGWSYEMRIVSPRAPTFPRTPHHKATLQELVGRQLLSGIQETSNKLCSLLFLPRRLAEWYYLQAIEVTMFDTKRALNFGDM